MAALTAEKGKRIKKAILGTLLGAIPGAVGGYIVGDNLEAMQQHIKSNRNNVNTLAGYTHRTLNNLEREVGTNRFNRNSNNLKDSVTGLAINQRDIIKGLVYLLTQTPYNQDIADTLGKLDRDAYWKYDRKRYK